MLLTHRIFLALVLLLLLDGAARSEDEFVGSGNPGHGSVFFRLELYDNPDDGAGNPFLDESLTVIEPAIVLTYDVNDRLSLRGQLSYDRVSSASIKRLSAFPQQSGASGDNYVGLDVGVDYELSERTRIGGFGSTSFEYDYTSFGLGGRISRDSKDHASTVSLTANGYFDQLKIIRYNGVDEGTDTRYSLTASLAWYRLINRNLHGELGATFTAQSGFLSTPFNGVVVLDSTLDPNPALENLAQGTEIEEVLPDTRSRTTVYGQLRHALGARDAAGLLGRVYTDSWGIQSFSLEPRFYHWLVQGRVNLRLRYRYYSQTAAEAHSWNFTTVEATRTQDSDLADFYSHGVGLRLDFQLSGRTGFDVLVDYTARSDRIDQLFGGLGYRRSF